MCWVRKFRVGASNVSQSHTWHTRQCKIGARVSATLSGVDSWNQPCPHSAPFLPQDTAIRWSRAALSPIRTPVSIRNFSPAISRKLARALSIGSILSCGVHQRKVLLGGGTPRPNIYTKKRSSRAGKTTWVWYPRFFITFRILIAECQSGISSIRILRTGTADFRRQRKSVSSFLDWIVDK